MNLRTLNMKALRQPADFPLDCLPRVLRQRVEDVSRATAVPVPSAALASPRLRCQVEYSDVRQGLLDHAFLLRSLLQPPGSSGTKAQ